MDPTAVGAGHVGLDLERGVAVPQHVGGISEVLELGGKDAVGVTDMTAKVVGAAIVADEHGATKAMRLDEKIDLIAEQTVMADTDAAAPAQPGGPTGHCQAIVSRQAEVVVKELVEVVTVAAVTAVDGNGHDALGFEGDTAAVDDLHGGMIALPALNYRAIRTKSTSVDWLNPHRRVS
jgi:hypothetical protein